MKKRIVLTLVSLILCVASFACFSGIQTFADGSHGYYMTCYSDVVNKKSIGFMIDFYSDSDQAVATYWSNMNFSMYTAPTERKLNARSWKGGGAYAGLQIVGSPTDRKGIFSFWRYEYKDKTTKEDKTLYAKAIVGRTTTYDNEGSGTSCVMPYNWKSSQWYREMIFCWTDEETGKTFAGNWYYDYEADKWTLFAYYDLGLYDSYFVGDIGQFLENFSESKGNLYRSFRYRNIYFQSQETGEWVSSPTVYLRSDGNAKAHGECHLGVSEDGTYVWADVYGDSEIDSDAEMSINPTLVQADKPEYGTPIIKLDVAETEKSSRIAWVADEHSTPQLSYKVVISDDKGNELATASGTRPEVANVSIADIGKNYKCDVTVTDVFGQSVTETYYSSEYGQEPVPTETPATETPVETETPATETPATETPATETPVETETPATETPAAEVTTVDVSTLTGGDAENGLSTGAKIAISVGASVAALGIAAGVVVLVKKKK